MLIKLRIITLLLFNTCFAFELKTCKSASYDQLCKLQDNYDETKVPGNLPLTLTLWTTDVMGITEVNIIEGYITIMLRLSICWKDQNLSFKSNQSYIALDKNIAELIWHPKISYFDIKSLERVAGIGYDKLNQYYIYNDDNLNLEMHEAIRITVYCDFDFSSFPFDDQECDLSLYDPVTDLTRIIINETKHLCNNGICKQGNEWLMLQYQHKIPYSIRMKNIGSRDHTFGDSDIYGESWSVSVSSIRFSLQRNSLDLLIGGFYLPTGIFAILSMGSYIINPEMVSPKTP